MFRKQKVSAVLLFSLVPFLFAEQISLPHLFAFVGSSSDGGEVTLSGEDLESFSSTEEALESAGISFKESNNELTFHGFWNSSIKVYVNGILMNDPNTGKFDFSALDISSVRKIKINPASTDGSVSVYIETLSADYTRLRYSFGGFSKSYFSFHDLSPNDTWRLHGSLNYPFNFKDGSSLMIQENVSGGYDANHYGYVSSNSSYEPQFKDSYVAWKERRAGWERDLLNNSFSALYSSSKMPGATFGFSNFISWNNQSCGRTGGYYYNYENQEDLNGTFAFPVFIPANNFRLKITPAYKLSSLKYTKDSIFSKVNDSYLIHSFSITEESTIYKLYDLNVKVNYDFCKENKLLDFYLEPGVEVNFAGFDFTLKAPFSLFYTASSSSAESSVQPDFLYFIQVGKSFTFNNEEDKLSLFINSSRSITNPVFQQLYYDGGGGVGNPGLKTESAFSFFGGATWKGSVEASVKPFLIFYKDKIAWVPYDGINWRPENSGSSTNYGFDFSFDSGNLFDRFTLKANYTLCRAMLTTNSQVYGKQIMYTPIHNLNVTGEFTPVEDLKLSLLYNFVSKKYETNDNTNFVPAQHYVDGRVDYKIKKGSHETALYLLWKNIFDFKYTEVSGYPGSGASLTFGFSVKN